MIYSGGADLDILPQHASKGKGLEFLLGEVMQDTDPAPLSPMHCLQVSVLWHCWVAWLVCSCVLQADPESATPAMSWRIKLGIYSVTQVSQLTWVSRAEGILLNSKKTALTLCRIVNLLVDIACGQSIACAQNITHKSAQ